MKTAPMDAPFAKTSGAVFNEIGRRAVITELPPPRRELKDRAFQCVFLYLPCSC